MLFGLSSDTVSTSLGHPRIPGTGVPSKITTERILDDFNMGKAMAAVPGKQCLARN